MNPRRVHELMQEHFPPLEAASREWQNLADVSGVRKESLSELLARYISADVVLVEVNRFLGDFLARPQALEFIAEHVGKANIRATDREFKGFVYVASNGAATGWHGT